MSRILVAGNSAFFYVKRIEDPISLLPAKLILGINKRCTFGPFRRYKFMKVH